MDAGRGDSLRPRLEKVEEELDESIDAVCKSPRVGKVDTGELIRIEETLSIAANSAKQAVSLRRKLREDGARSDGEEGGQNRAGGVGEKENV